MLDMTHRYAPTRIYCKCKLVPVQQYIAYPPGKHPKYCPIVKDLTALEFKTENGSRWYGFKDAYINSELRMVVVGIDTNDEVLMKWEVCKYPIKR